MKISYRIAALLFFILFMAPVVALGLLVERRISERQVILQRFLQNQTDIDRQILAQRALLREIHANASAYLLKTAAEPRVTPPPPPPPLKDDLEKYGKFWKRYEATYTAGNRPFLKEILEATQESSLISEEEEAVRKILVSRDAYVGMIASYPALQGKGTADTAEIANFLLALARAHDEMYGFLDQLADIRYIYAQRVVLAISGENDRQQGFFAAIFVGLLSSVFVVAVLQYFFIHKPFKDIMLFLRDLAQGKRGQRLYFSSPVKEVKESEDIINKFVSQAEEHEAHDHEAYGKK